MGVQRDGHPASTAELFIHYAIEGQLSREPRMKSQLRVIGAVVLSLAVFMVDAFTTVNGAIAVVYIVAIRY